MIEERVSEPDHATMIEERVSEIHGHGVFASSAIPKDTWISCEGVVSGFNHGCSPNVVSLATGPLGVLTTRDIALGEELLVRYPVMYCIESCRCPDCREHHA